MVEPSNKITRKTRKRNVKGTNKTILSRRNKPRSPKSILYRLKKKTQG